MRPAASRPPARAASVSTSVRRFLEASMPMRLSGSTSLASAATNIAPAMAKVPLLTPWMPPCDIHVSPAAHQASTIRYGSRGARLPRGARPREMPLTPLHRHRAAWRLGQAERAVRTRRRGLPRRPSPPVQPRPGEAALTDVLAVGADQPVVRMLLHHVRRPA